MEARDISATGTSGVQVTLRVAWDQAEEVPTAPANQFMASLGVPNAKGAPDGVHLIIGHLAPPLVYGTPEEMKELAENLNSVKVDVQGRFVMTRERLDELIAVLQSAAQQYDAATGSRGEGQ